MDNTTQDQIEQTNGQSTELGYVNQQQTGGQEDAQARADGEVADLGNYMQPDAIPAAPQADQLADVTRSTR